MKKLSKKQVCPAHDEDDDCTDFIFGETFDFYAACKTCKVRTECQKACNVEEEAFYDLVNEE